MKKRTMTFEVGGNRVEVNGSPLFVTTIFNAIAGIVNKQLGDGAGSLNFVDDTEVDVGLDEPEITGAPTEG